MITHGPNMGTQHEKDAFWDALAGLRILLGRYPTALPWAGE